MLVGLTLLTIMHILPGAAQPAPLRNQTGGYINHEGKIWKAEGTSPFEGSCMVQAAITCNSQGTSGFGFWKTGVVQLQGVCSVMVHLQGCQGARVSENEANL